MKLIDCPRCKGTGLFEGATCVGCAGRKTVTREEEKMKRFTWTKEATYGNRGPIFYQADKQPYGKDYQKTFITAMLESRVNGRGTAFCRVTLSVEWPSFEEQQWGCYLYRHEFGPQAANKLRAWANFLLNHPPGGFQFWEGHKG